MGMRKHLRRRGGSTDHSQPRKKAKGGVAGSEGVSGEEGTGTPRDPLWCPMRNSANQSGCFHCPTSSCDCVWFSHVLEDVYRGLSCKREVLRYHRSDLCAKSILPPFVARLVRLANLVEGEVFFDFGCGNGSVLFQVAYLTGRKCVGIEVNPVNAKVAVEAWRTIRPILEERCGRPLNVEIICEDFCKLLKDEDYFGHSSVVVWAANLLLPRPVNHFLSERFRSIPKGSRVFCFYDLYPHSRSVAAMRDPDVFARFDMVDYRWQPQTVEWCDVEGIFYKYVRK